MRELPGEQGYSGAPMIERRTEDLMKPIYRAVGLSMALTGLVTRDGRDFWNHDDYDEAMAALQELFRRARS